MTAAPARPDAELAALARENHQLEADVVALKRAQLDSLALLAENQQLRRALGDLCREVWHRRAPERTSAFHTAERSCGQKFCDDPAHDELAGVEREL